MVTLSFRSIFWSLSFATLKIKYTCVSSTYIWLSIPCCLQMAPIKPVHNGKDPTPNLEVRQIIQSQILKNRMFTVSDHASACRTRRQPKGLAIPTWLPLSDQMQSEHHYWLSPMLFLCCVVNMLILLVLVSWLVACYFSNVVFVVAFLSRGYNHRVSCCHHCSIVFVIALPSWKYCYHGSIVGV